MGVTKKKVGAARNSRKNHTKKLQEKTTGGELMCKKFGVNGRAGALAYRVSAKEILRSCAKTTPTDSRSPDKNCSVGHDLSDQVLQRKIPSQQGKLPTEKNIPENYLEIGNGLPTRKSSVWELFGSVTGIKSVII